MAGFPVRGYRLMRFDAETQVAVAVGDGCSGLLHQTPLRRT
jgi:hypothetical protein